MTAGWRTDAAAWWASPAWRDYEVLYDGAPGARTRLLAEATWRTRIVDLVSSEAELWRGVRKSYRSLIHRARERYEFSVGGVDAVMLARLIHREVAGRETRPKATWHLMADWIEQRSGLVVIGHSRLSGQGEAFAYFLMNGTWAYYASGASVDDNVQHAVIWYSLLALKARGIRWAELGWQGQATDDKGRGIEMFRRGWGGVDVSARLDGCTT